jgi:GTP-dependent phosphoenolpyruvate carboxykinase
LTSVDVEGWLSEIPKIREFYERFGHKMPATLMTELGNLEARLKAAQ